MTLGKLIQRAREGLSDTVKEYRWTDSFLILSFFAAIRRLQAVRPESRYVDGQLKVTSFPSVDTTNADNSTANAWEIPVDERWHEGLVYYAMAKCLEVDSSDTENASLSADFLSKAETRFQQ